MAAALFYGSSIHIPGRNNKCLKIYVFKLIGCILFFFLDRELPSIELRSVSKSIEHALVLGYVNSRYNDYEETHFFVCILIVGKVR